MVPTFFHSVHGWQGPDRVKPIFYYTRSGAKSKLGSSLIQWW
ncbi:hypothetical protein LVIS_0484 [Levilactobacillus brevis ATCC 367]|uniref:Uncharacterized protein n=1 Tax=Levilactobacillus brevis (strain ATCC 367 / BCRC 12310 / CIP 105137 / JCM 1170 / LMG 11437 / NCIMB 947 / NCTC 947) TaxID=387344 RepID=Q03T30_LEVBA|nr:hypothetical protein LVIS_0484 [Levilactobacillus brevis ATCC 367]GEB07187.1 hypothetical protein LBR03_20740 [Levilactobacillus brevis]